LRILSQVHLPTILTAHKIQALYFQRDFSFKIWYAFIVSPCTSSQDHFIFKILTFWDVMPCGLVDRSEHSEGTCSSIFRVDGDSRFLQNVGCCLENYTLSHVRRL
jgi:hypothetical protein